MEYRSELHEKKAERKTARKQIWANAKQKKESAKAVSSRQKARPRFKMKRRKERTCPKRFTLYKKANPQTKRNVNLKNGRREHLKKEDNYAF